MCCLLLHVLPGYLGFALDSNGRVDVLQVRTTRVGLDESSSSIVEGRMYTEIPLLRALFCGRLFYCVSEHQRIESEETPYTLGTPHILQICSFDSKVHVVCRRLS